jgi:enoyl-CoA hydratase
VSGVLYLVESGVATIMLDRPEARNALNGAMCDALCEAAGRAAADESVRLVLVRGNGPVFCAGADVKERQGMGKEEVRARRLKGFAAYAALEALPMPAIAVVQGAALGSGVEIAAACDFIVALPDATFGTPEALRGTVGATQRLPRVLGKRLAKDLMFTGRVLSAEEARVAGLVSRIAPLNEFEAVKTEIAASILQAPPLALRLAKRAIDRGIELDPRGARDAELEAIEEQLASGEWMGKSGMGTR